MTVLGRVESLWRYPVKSMRGEELEEAFLGFAGVYGDRIYAFRSAASGEAFPYLTARVQKQMLRYQPRFRHSVEASRPINLAVAEALGPGVTPLYAHPDDLVVDVETPAGEVFPIDDTRLVERLREGIGAEHELTLLRSERALTDCRPISLLSIQTARQLGAELSREVDPRRFRANICVDLEASVGFAEDDWVGRSLRIGTRAVVSILERDPRCQMITLDPDTAESDPKVLRAVAQGHESMAGVYGAVLVEGMIRRGDPIEVIAAS